MSYLDKNGLIKLTSELVKSDVKTNSSCGNTVTKVANNITREFENFGNSIDMSFSNNISNFNIGDGYVDNVRIDCSADVENGFSEIGLKGQTWQNLSDLKSLGSERLFDKSDGADVIERLFFLNNGAGLFKPKTTYSIIIDFTISEFYQYDSTGRVYIEGLSKSVNEESLWLKLYNTKTLYNKDGRYKDILRFETAENFSYMSSIYIAHTRCKGKINIHNAVILEGDYTNTATDKLPQFFTGIKSSFEDGVVEVNSIGKNLFPINDMVSIYEDNIPNNNTCTIFLSEGTYYINTNYIESTGGSALRFLVRSDSSAGSIVIPLTHLYSKVVSIKIPKDGMYFFRFDRSSSGDGFRTSAYIQIEKSKSTEYEPYSKQTYTSNITSPLIKLPNGVCDEIIGNKLIRRIGKKTFNGSEDITLHIDKGVVVSFRLPTLKTKNSMNTISTISDVISSNTFSKLFESGNTEGVSVHNSSNVENVYLFIKKSRLTTADIVGVKKWLASNNITVYYELFNPIITNIEEISFNIKKGSSIDINSYICPVSTHKAQLNRAGQIERTIQKVSDLKERVDVLDSFYSNYFIELNHKLSLLNMDYNIDNGGV